MRWRETEAERRERREREREAGVNFNRILRERLEEKNSLLEDPGVQRAPDQGPHGGGDDADS